MNALREGPIRLVTITHCFPARGGGIERVAGRLIDEFTARGVHVDWYSSDTATAPETTTGRAPHAVPTLNIVERLTQLPYPIWSLGTLPSLWRSVGSADLVHIHEHLYSGSILAMLVARMRRRPVVITQHMGALGLRNRAATALYTAGSRLLGFLMFSGAARTVFISTQVRQFFKLQHSNRSRLIFNGIDPALFPAAPSATRAVLRERLGLADQRRIVLFVGRFVRKKGLDIIEALARRFPQVQWVFVGAGPEDPGNWRQANVRVIGPVSQTALADFYHACDLLILPSYGEGFPLVVQEALACGLGVLSTEEVASACPPAAPLIRSLPTARIEADTEPWEAAVRSVLEDQAYLEDRATRAAKARELWSWNRCAREYLELFEEVRHAG